MTYILLVIVIVLQSVAQILEKHGMNQIGSLNGLSVSTVIKMVGNPYVFFGVFLSVLGLVAWLVALSRANVSYLHPLGAVSYIIIAVLANKLLGEHITGPQWIGIGVIAVGAVMVNIK